MEVPEHLSRCRVLLNFLREDQPDCDVIPTRIYEYLSTGRPIVSMLWPDQVEHFPDVVYGAHSHQEFLTLCEHALEEPPAPSVPRGGGGLVPPCRTGLPDPGHRRSAVRSFCPGPTSF